VSVYRFIGAERANHSVRILCRVLCVSRSSFYEWCRGRTWQGEKDACALVHIKAAHRRSRGTYGSPRVAVELREQGLNIGRRRVARLMSENGLSGVPKRRFRGSTTDSAHTNPVAPNLLDRQFTVARPNEVWVGDITYLPVNGGWVYLAVLIDLYSRKVVGWSMADNMETQLCMKALQQAVNTRRGAAGTMHHTDRGSQYTSKAYTSALMSFGMVQSMSRKGNCWDNAVAESFFGTLEQELVQGGVWANLAAADNAVADYIHKFYNHERRHSKNDYLSPVDFEAHNQAAERQAA
jgi:putative transposase